MITTHFVGWDEAEQTPAYHRVYRIADVERLDVTTRTVLVQAAGGHTTRRIETKLVAHLSGRGTVDLTGWWSDEDVDAAQAEFLRAWTGSGPSDPWARVWTPLDDSRMT